MSDTERSQKHTGGEESHGTKAEVWWKPQEDLFQEGAGQWQVLWESAESTKQLAKDPRKAVEGAEDKACDSAEESSLPCSLAMREGGGGQKLWFE